MEEIVDDIKVDLVEAVGQLGIRLSSDNTRITHSETGLFDISSKGTINISSGNSEIYTEYYKTPGNINIGSKDATDETGESISINIIGGRGTDEIEGGSVNIKSGSGQEGQNSDGGEVFLETGNGEGTGNGGQLNIRAGFGRQGDGGDIYIQAGNSNNNIEGGATGGNIIIESGNGATKCGDVNVFLGPSDTFNNYNVPFFGPTGRFNIYYGAFRLAIYQDNSIRDLRIPTPVKGDMCFVDDKIQVHNGTDWKTLAFEL